MHRNKTRKHLKCLIIIWVWLFFWTEKEDQQFPITGWYLLEVFSCEVSDRHLRVTKQGQNVKEPLVS